MKLLFLAVFISFSSLIMAQPPQGGGRGQMMEMMKQRMKEEAKLTDAKADSVISIQREFQPKQREIRMNQSLTDDEKKAKVKTLMEDRKKRWKTSGLTDEEIQRVDKIYENMQQAIQQRGGMPGGN